MKRFIDLSVSAFLLCGKTRCSSGNQVERSFLFIEIFQEKGIPSEVFLFSRFYRNSMNRNITVPFARSYLWTCAMLLDQLTATVNG